MSQNEERIFDGGADSDQYVGWLYREARERIVCVGATFYRTLKLHKNTIVELLNRGCYFDVCFLAKKADFGRIAPQFGQTADQLKTEVDATWAEADELSQRFPKLFRPISTLNCPLSRSYIIDPDSERPKGLIIFYGASTDSVRLPAWKVDNFKDVPWRAYFDDAIQKIATEANNDVFILHGHNEAKWRELKELLQGMGAHPVLLSETKGLGSASWLDRFTRVAQTCEFAIAIFTEDDCVLNKGKKYFQPRPNVLLEMGYFIAKLSVENMLILVQGEIKLPSDLEGVVYKKFTNGVSELRHEIEQELKEANVI